MNHDIDDEVISEIRLRSQRFVQVIFAAFTLAFAALGLVAHHTPEWLALVEGQPRQVADTFLVIAAAYAVCLYAWEHIYTVQTD